MTNKRFALRVDSGLPVQISVLYLGHVSEGQGILQELSRVGCRILGKDPVVAGETLTVRIELPSSPKSLIIEQATVRWVKGLEFGVVFHDLPQREANRLQHLLEALLSSESYSRPAGSLNVKPPVA